MERKPSATSRSCAQAQGSEGEPERKPQKRGRFANKKEKSKAKEKKKLKVSRPSDGATKTSQEDATPGNVPNPREPRVAEVDGATATAVHAGEFTADVEARRDSGIEDDPSRSTGSTPGMERSRNRVDARTQRRSSQDLEERSSAGQRSKSRSRSGSRKRFSSLFRRRGRSGRSKSETDITRVDRREAERRHESADDMKERKLEEAQKSSSRLRQSASLDRSAYRQYDPAKQPRDRLLHMKVKDAIIEDRRRRNVSVHALASQRRQSSMQRAAGLSSSVPDVSNGGSAVAPADVLHDNEVFQDSVSKRALTKAGATLPRHSRSANSTSPSPHNGHPTDTERAGKESSGPTPGKSSADAEKPVGKGAEKTQNHQTLVSSMDTQSCEKRQTDSRLPGRTRVFQPSDNAGIVIFINPKDIIESVAPVETSEPKAVQNVTASQSGLPTCQTDDPQQRRLNTFTHFLELRKTMPAFSSSSMARERRVSRPGESGETSRDPSPKHEHDLSPGNIPSSETRDQGGSPSTGEANALPSSPGSAETAASCGRLEAVPYDMISSFASSKRSSDQGFFSEPKSSDTDSEDDTSGFSTPPEEPGNSKPAPSGMSPVTLVTEVKNRLEVPSVATMHKSVGNVSAQPSNVRKHKPSMHVQRSPSKHGPSDSGREGSPFACHENLEVSRDHRATRGQSSEKDNQTLHPKCTVNTVPERNERQGTAMPERKGQKTMSEQSKRQTEQNEQAILSEPNNQKMVSERNEQKSMPVMGTSVQQKYRRTFQQGNSKERPRENTLEVPSERLHGNLAPSCASDRSPSPISIIIQDVRDTPDDAHSSDGPLNELVKRGRDSQRRRGYVSSRSFRKKKEPEMKEVRPEKTEDKSERKESPRTEEKDEGKSKFSDDMPEANDDSRPQGKRSSQLEGKSGCRWMHPTDGQQRESDRTDAEASKELRQRQAFLDKSTQTSESLLYELLNKTKAKKKAGLFASTGKKAKETELQLPPPPQYEEERKVAQSHEEEEGFVDARSHPPTPTNEIQLEPSLACEGVDVKRDENEAKRKSAHGENGSPKAGKGRRLPLRSIVLLKQKLARNRKKRRQVAKNGKEQENEEDKAEPDLPSETIFTIENEINLSKLAEIKETDILDDEIIEPDFGPALPKKQLRFEPIASDEAVQGEEPLPPFLTSRRLATRRNSTRARERRKKCLHCCKKFIAFLFSHIGLCSLVVGYTILGGVVFQALEAPNEKKIKNDITLERIKVVNRIESLATEYQLREIGRENLTQKIQKELIDYQKFIHTETKEKGWDGKEINETQSDGGDEDSQWSFASALLYAITVMTTIGYGHVAPKTSSGRIVTIGYAVLGIPLTLLCLTNIGDVMATGFRLLYGKVCCGLCCKLFKPSRRRRRIPDAEKGMGRQVMTSEQAEIDKPKEVIQVPTSLCLLLIAGYIFAGALLFSLWEQWDYLTGSYFCFITLSTIGFGDIVPGMDINAWSKEEKLVLSALYLIFGLSLIAMCFNLVQEDVKAKCRWLGMKIGIIDKPEPPV